MTKDFPSMIGLNPPVTCGDSPLYKGANGETSPFTRRPCERTAETLKNVRSKAMKYAHNPKLVPLAKELRKNMTKEERKLWFEYLRNYPERFLRQKIIGNYIVDFYCSAANLIVELDGSQHFEQEGLDKDRERTAYLENLDLYVFRIPNNAVHENFEGVCEAIDAIVKQRKVK